MFDEKTDWGKLIEEDNRWANAVPVKESDMHATQGYRLTLCEMLRQIYLRSDDPYIKIRCRMATTMAKVIVQRVTRVEGAWWGRNFYPWNITKGKHRIAHVIAKWGDRAGERGWGDIAKAERAAREQQEKEKESDST